MNVSLGCLKINFTYQVEIAYSTMEEELGNSMHITSEDFSEDISEISTCQDIKHIL